ncbi:hypothetical protein NQ317_011463 [Molorchus minor]|uniref:Uncharacterized protein n=1 Tax=Molorchus minor TaxID=1323400 RepID=A0ABQ9JJG8_9CUCU|nr:hypothetical protein NQ317_011463 [Molorchus minor]
MLSGSDSDEFYDAEDNPNTPNHGTRKLRKSSKDSLSKRANSEPNISDLADEARKSKSTFKLDEAKALPEPQIRPVPVGGRKKFKELRQRLQNDDEDCLNTNVTPPNSQTSSVEGVFAASNKPSHPFRIIEQDTISLQSLNSLGRVGRILGGVSDTGATISDHGRKTVSVSALSSSSLDSESTQSSKHHSQYPSTMTLSTGTTQSTNTNNKACVPLQEPDVIASTKSSSTTQKSFGITQSHAALNLDAPVAPPRRKKKKQSPSECYSTHTPSTIESLTREFEHSLDRLPSIKSTKSDRIFHSDSKSSTLKSGHSLNINQALKGQFVVKPQDNDSLKAQRISKISDSPDEDNQGTLGLPIEISAHNSPRGSSNRKRRRSTGDENIYKDVNLHVRTHTDSGKQLSDLEILEQVTVLNLDTGERVPLSVAEDKLPAISSMEKEKESDEESIDNKKSEIPIVDENDAK